MSNVTLGYPILSALYQYSASKRYLSEEKKVFVVASLADTGESDPESLERQPFSIFCMTVFIALKGHYL